MNTNRQGWVPMLRNIKYHRRIRCQCWVLLSFLGKGAGNPCDGAPDRDPNSV